MAGAPALSSVTEEESLMSSQPSLTKRELREQRRADRVAAERAEAAAAARRTRTWRLLAAAGLAVVVVGVAAIVSSSGGSADTPTPRPSQAASLFDGIEEHNGVLGDPKAPITLTEYVDLQCPICAAASRDTLPTVVRDYVRTGKVKLQARTLHFIGPDSVRAAQVAAGAEQQGRLWPFLEAFYAAQGEENSGYVTDEFLRSVASASGVDAGKALKTADGAVAQDRLNRANSDAQTLGIDSTPTFTIARGDGKPQVLAAHDADTVANAIDKELAG
jgi:protein-disulfide isomerase